MTIILGIDPGGSGGIAALDLHGHAAAHKMPETERDILDLILSLDGRHAIIEHVHSLPRDSAKAAFTFGMSYGGLRMALLASACPFETVAPNKWEKAFGLPTLKESGSKTKKKNAHKARAQELYPELKITHATADALLIATYGLRLYTERTGASA